MLFVLASAGVVETIADLLSHFAYGGVFGALFFAGWLIPLPEEPLIIAAGYLAFRQNLSVVGMIVAALAGVLAGDLVIYNIGRRHGDWVFRSRVFRKLLPQERLGKARALFAEHGSKMVFFGRFPAGIRLAVFFMAGNLGVPVPKFLFYDFLAALVAIPVSVWAGWYFGAEIEHALSVAERFRVTAILVISASALLVIGVRRLRRGKGEAQAAQPQSACAVEGGAPPEPRAAAKVGSTLANGEA